MNRTHSIKTFDWCFDDCQASLHTSSQAFILLFKQVKLGKSEGSEQNLLQEKLWDCADEDCQYDRHVVFKLTIPLNLPLNGNCLTLVKKKKISRFNHNLLSCWYDMDNLWYGRLFDTAHISHAKKVRLSWWILAAITLDFNISPSTKLTLLLAGFSFAWSCIFVYVARPSPYLWVWYCVVFGLCTLCHLVPSIIDGQGQRACQRHSTQPKCDKATQSDRSKHSFLTAFTFSTHFTHFHASGTAKSPEGGGKIGGGKREQQGGKVEGKYIFF